jgi:organic radical activating enzyme
MREETRRAVGAERQRVAGMLYKEALQTHTLEEQAGQIDELITEVAGAKQLAAERDRLVAERDQISAELQALAESRSEHVQSILNLDDQLAIEQQTRQEAQLLLQQTQAALAQRAAREAEATKRVQQAENTLAAYKVSSSTSTAYYRW